MVVFPLIFISGCATPEQRLTDSAKVKAQINAGRYLPEFPPDWRLRARSGVKIGDRADVALLKTDEALSRQNGRTRRCVDWYRRIRGGVAGRKVEAAR